ncbi:MAG: ATP-binding cassette domain-containing protein [Planctomycetota bacterium]|nr:ATP-binding cassette domain-containing protein [Planctomycetota bacterium]MCX8039536.1 ATP-binding cassette domain-containing protein [Planctomycetota bacterium]MDW8373341.1 ATP-binding cassette domain-containing protein [Planctomycetota bacterium]
MILCRGVGRDFRTPRGTLTVLDGVELEIAAGERVAILGPSGSGKSTLLGLLAGLDLPSRGRVIVDGQDLAALDEDRRCAWRARRCGFVFQSHRLLPALSALENVAVPLLLSGVPPPAAEARARAALERLGLGDRLHHRPAELSGGEQQRVAVARAIVHAPAVLFADEPTGSLDRTTGRALADLLFALAEREAMTLVLVTHDDALAARCQRSLRLHGGRLA